MPMLNREQLDFILKNALLAPSADNHHRIRFKLEDDNILIHHTEDIPLQGGYKRALALLSLGAVVENLAIAAQRFGLDSQAKLISDPSQPRLTIQIRLLPGQAAVDPLWQAIPLRHTNRQGFFHGPPISPMERSELESTVAPYPCSQLIWLDEPAQRNQALRLMRRAETERYRNRMLHEELFSAIRFDIGWHSTCPEGLPPGALAVEPPLRPLFAALRHWPAMRLAKLFGAHYILGLRSCYVPCRLAPNLGTLAVKISDNQSIFDTGRAFERLWLKLTSQGRVLQPMPASALYALDGVEAEGIPKTLRRELKQAWETCAPGHIPLMLFRIGFAKTSLILTARRPVKDYLDA